MRGAVSIVSRLEEELVWHWEVVVKERKAIPGLRSEASHV